jgi:large subunit ribosomal protein L21
MYAVIATGGKQYKVESGQVLDVERLGAEDGEVELRPVLLVDGASVLATPDQLGGATVTAKVVGEGR